MAHGSLSCARSLFGRLTFKVHAAVDSNFPFPFTDCLIFRLSLRNRLFLPLVCRRRRRERAAAPTLKTPPPTPISPSFVRYALIMKTNIALQFRLFCSVPSSSIMKTDCDKNGFWLNVWPLQIYCNILYPLELESHPKGFIFSVFLRHFFNNWIRPAETRFYKHSWLF